MNPQERLRQTIDQRQDRLRAGIPPDRQAAILALLRAQDGLSRSPGSEPRPDIVSGHRLANLGGNKALHLCLEALGNDVESASAASGDGSDGWSERFLEECGRLAEAELVLGHCETGFMGLVDDGAGSFDAWITTKRAPANWRERADIDWWAVLLAKQHEAEWPDRPSSTPGDDGYYRRLADMHLKQMACQLAYPPDAVIDGCTIQTYREVLRRLIALALAERDRGEVPAPRSERALVALLAKALRVDPAIISRAMAAFTLDRESAAYHAAVPGVAVAPLVRLAPDQLVWSLYGLTTEPLFFLTRELRRRDAQEYSNTAYHRETIFREDLYALFQDKRFVTSTGKVELRREAGTVRTDIDAVVFDRKTGALAFFELKSQDPFARSTAELARQRDNLLYANRQISGALAWLQRYGADALLLRVDSRTAKTFRAYKVYPFVLGRYLAHFSDGAEPDRRAAWGTWPQLLRLLDGQPVRAGDANPIASLFNRLVKDAPRVGLSDGESPREINLGAARLVVHPSFASLQASMAAGRGGRARP